MRTITLRRVIFAAAIALIMAGASLTFPGVRGRVRALVRPELPPPITPLALAAPVIATVTPRPAALPTATPRPTATRERIAATLEDSIAHVTIPTRAPTLTPTPAPVVVNGRVYDAYLPAASKESQAYQYSCEFDAAWVILRTYGFEASVDELIAIVGQDRSVEPRIRQTSRGVIIEGGDILTAFSGDYTSNFLARSSGSAMRKAFEHYGLRVEPVHDRAGVEAALRGGALVWMKTTVDFNRWRPATWVTPDGAAIQTVLGNDHAVVAIGFNAESVVIRDVLGPTSSNWKRPYEYEVSWPVFLAAWGAQQFDGLAVAPPERP